MRHMKTSQNRCSKFIVTCSGCNKDFTTKEKLTLHQLLRKNAGHYKCYDRSSVVDMSSTIQISDLNNTSSSGKKYLMQLNNKFYFRMIYVSKLILIIISLSQ